MDKSYFTRKEQIILSTIELIDELGIDGLSIREIAKKEKITEGAIYRHFKSKNEIIIEVLRYYSQFDINIKNTINNNKLASKAAIIFCLTSVSEYYENYPEITAVSCSFERLIYEPDIEDEVLLIINRRYEFILFLVEKGIISGEFNDCTNSEDLTDIIMGSFNQIVFKWRIKKYKFSLKKKILDMLDIIF